jgi:hypothetical protein
MKNKKTNKSKTNKPVQCGALGQALNDIKEWTAGLRFPAIEPPAEVEDIGVVLGQQFATLLRQPAVERLMEEVPPLLSNIRRARQVSEEEAAKLLSMIKLVFSEALESARKVIDESGKAKKTIQEFEQAKSKEIETMMAEARREIERVVNDFTKHVETLRSATETARGIETTLGTMRAHATSIRATILKNMEEQQYEAANENIKAMFALYDVDLRPRFSGSPPPRTSVKAPTWFLEKIYKCPMTEK